MANGHEDALLVKLGDESWYRVELCVGEKTHEMGAVAGGDMIALEMQRNVAKGQGITINVEGAHGGVWVSAVFFGLFDLAEEVLGEVGWS